MMPCLCGERTVKEQISIRQDFAGNAYDGNRNLTNLAGGTGNMVYYACDSTGNRKPAGDK